MIARIACKEFTEMTRDGRFRVAAAVVAALLLASLAMGWKRHVEIDAQRRDAARMTRRQWLEQGVKNPHSAAHYGTYAFKPKPPLSLIDPGVDAYTGVAVWLEAHKRNDLKYRPAQDATAVARFGELTAASVLQLLVPLLIILLAFPAFAGERDQGTLRQLLSLGVRPRDLALGKALGVSLALGLLLVPAAVVGVVALATLTGAGSLMAEAPRIAVMAVGYLLYYGAFIGLALAVSAWAGSARAALLILLGFWIVNGLIAPRLAVDLARRLHPTPSALAFSQALDRDLKQGVNAHDPNDPRFLALKARVLREQGVERMEDLEIDFAGVALQESEEHGYRVYDAHYGALWKTFVRQDDVQRAVASASPLLAVRSLSMAMAGTEPDQNRDFARAAEDYRRRLIRIINEDITEHGKGPKVEYLAGDEVWAKVPDFSYTAPGFSRVAARRWPDLAALAGWCAASAFLAAASASRIRAF
jgi:ABC-2 type transport system permease protein